MRTFTSVLSLVLFLMLCISSNAQVDIQYLSTYQGTGAEIVAYDAATQRLFASNAEDNTVDAIDISDPANPTLAFSITPAMGEVNSVAVSNGTVAVASALDQDPGFVFFYDTDGNHLKTVGAGALPDMIIFTPDGSKLLVANEGEPDDDYVVDPEGSVSIIDLSAGVANATVQHATFGAFNGATLDPSIRIFGPGASVAQDLEPEYIAVTADGSKAYVVCQENNAFAIINVNTATVTDLVGLGFKDHSLPGNALDPSNRDDGIQIANHPVLGMYQPDAIVGYQRGGRFFVLSANEGDARDYDGFSEEERMDDLDLDPTVFPNAADLQEDEVLGRLKTTTVNGDTDGDGDYDELYSYGARSFSIWDKNGKQVYDSGDDFEYITAQLRPDLFNGQGTAGSYDSRSDDKGCEPEAITIAYFGGVPHALIGLERIGGFMVYNISNIYQPYFVTYINNDQIDRSPESIIYISPEDSPNGQDIVVTANEVSATVSLFTVQQCVAPAGGSANIAYDSSVPGELTVTWENTGAAEYIFQIRRMGSSWETYFPNTNSITLDNLVDGALYQVRIASICGDGNDSPFTTFPRFRYNYGVSGLEMAQEEVFATLTALFPNPTSDLIAAQIQSTGDSDALIKVQDVFGRTIITRNDYIYEGENHLVVGVNNLPAGNYLLVIETAESRFAEQFTKQ